MRNTALLLMGICMFYCAVCRKEWISVPRKASIESVLEFELESLPASPSKSIAEVCTATGHYFYTLDTSSESSLLGEFASWNSPKWIAPIHLEENDQRLYWYIWQQNNEQCVTFAHLFKYGLATYWDNIYIHSTQMTHDRPRLAPSDNDHNLGSLSKTEIGLSMIEIGLTVALLITVLTLLLVFTYSWYGSVCGTSKKPDVPSNTKKITWICRCGTIIQDSFSENVAGAAASYETELCTPSVRRFRRALDFECSIDMGVLIYEALIPHLLFPLALHLYAGTFISDFILTTFDKRWIISREDLTRSGLFLLPWIIRMLFAVSYLIPAVKLQQTINGRWAIFTKHGGPLGSQKPGIVVGGRITTEILVGTIPFFCPPPRGQTPVMDEFVHIWCFALTITSFIDTVTSDLVRSFFDNFTISPREDLTRPPLFLLGWIIRMLVAVNYLIPAAKLQQTSDRRFETLIRMMSRNERRALAAKVDAPQWMLGDGEDSKADPVDTGSLSQESNAHTAVENETSQRSKKITPRLGPSSKSGQRKSSHKDTTSSTETSQIDVLIAPQPEPLYLLLCIPQYKYATKVVHMDVKALTSDQQLFASLRTHYTTMRGRVRMLLSLKKLTSINFVQFEAYKSDLADIKKGDHMPPESKSDEYRYRPMPADVIPPVGREHMMHLYEHPDDAEDVGICLERIPKKLKERLAICPNRGTGVGWGVHFSEGMNWLLLYILGLLGLSLGILFGVLWAKFKSDVQGGFSIAACIMLGSTFTVGIIQAANQQK